MPTPNPTSPATASSARTSAPVDTTGDGLGGAALLSDPSFIDLTAVNGTTYYYVVIAVDAAASARPPRAEAVATPSANAGSALDFDGSNDYVTFGAAPALGLSTFTIETWFRRDGTGVATSTGTGGLTTAIPLVTKGRGEADQSNLDANWFLGIDTKGTATTADDTLAADFEDFETPSGTNNNHPVIGVTAIPVSATWHHAAVTYDAATDTWNLYLDGNLERTLALGGNFTPRSDSIQHAGLGTAMTSTGATAGFFDGVLDEVRIWNVARSQCPDPGRALSAADQRHRARRPLRPERGQWHERRQQRRRRARRHAHQRTPSGRPASRCPTASRRPRRPASPRPPGNTLVGLSWNANTESDLAGYRVFRSTSTPGRHDRQRPRRREPASAPPASPTRRAPTAPPTTTSSSPSTAAANRSAASADVPRHAVRRRRQRARLRRCQRLRHLRHGARAERHRLHHRDVVQAHRRGRRHDDRRRRHRERHPARRQGRPAGRDAGQHQHGLVPGHRRRHSGVLVADFEDNINGGNHPVAGTDGGHEQRLAPRRGDL